MGWIFSSGAYIKHTSEGVLQSFLRETLFSNPSIQSCARPTFDGADDRLFHLAIYPRTMKCECCFEFNCYASSDFMLTSRFFDCWLINSS